MRTCAELTFYSATMELVLTGTRRAEPAVHVGYVGIEPRFEMTVGIKET
jgi:hypothetical protein